jgi:hypothetical protein
MARDSCLVLRTLSGADAREIERLLKADGLDVERESEAVWIFVTGTNPRRRRKNLRNTRRLVTRALRRAGVDRAIAVSEVQVWNEERDEYVPIDHHGQLLDDEDWLASDLAPNEITHVVEIVPAGAFRLKELRRDLRQLRRPLLRGGLRHFDLGARDADDARRLATRAETFSAVKSARPKALGRIQRWVLHQRLLGNYSSDPGDYVYYQGDVGAGNGGGAGGGNGGS